MLSFKALSDLIGWPLGVLGCLRKLISESIMVLQDPALLYPQPLFSPPASSPSFGQVGLLSPYCFLPQHPHTCCSSTSDSVLPSCQCLQLNLLPWLLSLSTFLLYLYSLWFVPCVFHLTLIFVSPCISIRMYVFFDPPSPRELETSRGQEQCRVYTVECLDVATCHGKNMNICLHLTKLLRNSLFSQRSEEQFKQSKCEDRLGTLLTRSTKLWAIDSYWPLKIQTG